MDSDKKTFRLQGAELYASALHDQLIAHRRGTFEHDIKNLVQGFNAGLQLLSKALEAPSPRITPAQCAEMLAQQLVSLRNAMHQLLDDVAPAQELRAQAFDIGQLLHDCLRQLRHDLQSIEVTAAIPDGLQVLARRQIVRDSIMSLILQSVGRGVRLSIAVTAAAGRIEIRMWTSAGDAVHAEAGQELAEAIAAIIAADAGQIACVSEAENYLISLSMPAATAMQAADPTLTAQARTQRILVLDGNRDSADSLAMLLSLEGYAAVAAYDFADATGLIAQHRPDLVLFNIQSDGSRGGVAASEVRASCAQPPILVALCDRRSVAPQQAPLLFDHYLPHPLEIGALRTLMTG